MQSSDIRQKFLDFYQKKRHSILPSSPLVPENDPTSLFNSSGMQSLIPYLMGEKHPKGKRLADSQKCLRVDDIEEVGDSRHTTFFEMLGNWSLNNYFKKEQLNWWFEFLIEELKIDIQKLYSTVFEGDATVKKDCESVKILQKIYKKYGIQAREGRRKQDDASENVCIFAYPRKKNWWQRGEAIGELGGPDCETFYDTGKKHNSSFGKKCHINCDCGRFIEIGNSVFMEYQKTAKGQNPASLQGWQIMQQKNVDFGGGLERLTMILQKKNSIFETDLFWPIIQKIENISGKKYKESPKPFEIMADHLRGAVFLMAERIAPSNVEQGYVLRRLIRRSIRYSRLLDIKNKFLEQIAQIIIENYKDTFSELSDQKDFILLELEKEEDKFIKTLEKGLAELDKLDFITRQKDQNNQTMKQSNQVDSKKAFYLYQTFGFPLEMIQEELRKNGLRISEDEFQRELKKHQELSRKSSVSKFKSGLADSQEMTIKLHTATHLLNNALREILGKKVQQAGSNITAERLRFDFTYPEKLTENQLKEIEKNVNQEIMQALPVSFCEMDLKEAEKKGALAFFKNRYPDRVKVYQMGEYSLEICSGPHVKNTQELGKFKIVKEESSSAGVRRIKAVLF